MDNAKNKSRSNENLGLPNGNKDAQDGVHNSLASKQAIKQIFQLIEQKTM